jgi:hypothetical protein
MWRSLKNFLLSFWTYQDMSPDLRVRRQVKRKLRDRPLLDLTEWHEKFWQPLGVSNQVSEFVYGRFAAYSGLEWGRVVPCDRLIDDLRFPLVCWFDWQTALTDDFLAQFSVDLGIDFDPDDFITVEELVVFLNHSVLSVNHS